MVYGLPACRLTGSVDIGVIGAQSTLGRGERHFCLKININRILEFYMIFWPKNIFPDVFFFWGGAVAPSPTSIPLRVTLLVATNVLPLGQTANVRNIKQRNTYSTESYKLQLYHIHVGSAKTVTLGKSFKT